MTRHALRVTVALSELRQAHGDVLDALIPFFEPILTVMNAKVFDPGLLAAGVQRLYRWRFTRDVAEQFIPRLLRLGYLRREGTGKDAVYIVTFDSAMPVGAGNESFLTALSEIVDEFSRFPSLVSDLLHYDRDRAELEDVLIRFLVSIDAFGDGALDGSVRPDDPKNADALHGLPEGGRELSVEDRYIAARFVSDLCDRDPKRVADLTKIAAVGLLTEVVEDFIRPTDIAANVDLTIVLDAPVALDYLGLSGSALRADVRGVCDALRRIGCRLVVFPITCDEMQRNLQSMLSLTATDRHGYTHQAMVKGEVLGDYVQAVANDPQLALEAAGISIRSVTMDQYPAYHRYFSADVYEDFLSSIIWVVDVKPREHDAMCLALLMRLRQGHQSSDLFKCKYVFVTRNPTFARRSREYCIRGGMLSPTQEGAVVHQRELATIAWLRTGLDAETTVPRTNLVAACERILRVRPELTRAVAEKLKQVTTPEKLEQFKLLLLDQRSLRKLADSTLNDESVVTTDNAEQLLELMRAATAEEERKRHEQELDDQRQRFRASQDRLKVRQQKELEAKDSIIESQDAELLDRLRRYQEAKAEANAAHTHRMSLIAKAISETNTVTKRIDGAVTTILVLIALLSVFDLLTGKLSSQNMWHYVQVVFGAIGVYYATMEILQKPKLGLSTLLNWLAPRVLQQRLRVRGLVPTDAGELSITSGRVSASTE